jgi:PIN domain nuclease of toxin-antitoxin system
VRLLLDTHALLWWFAGDLRLSGAARKAIGDAANDVFVSAATAWEITTKYRMGRLSGAEAVAVDVAAAVAGQGFADLAITLQHGQLAGDLPPPHRDPFDRMLMAQAILEQMPIVSNETAFDQYSVRRLW